MIPKLYDAAETAFTSEGLGRLSDAISCIVTEERNGKYELELEYPVDGIHFSEIAHSRYIYAKPSDSGSPQPFSVYNISKPIDGKCTIKAEHISYRLSNIPVEPCEATTCAGALNTLKLKAVESCPFSFWTDKTSSGTFKVKEPASLRSRLAGSEGSILDAFGGGEYEWDGMTVKLYAQRGFNRGVTLRYGKNITDIKQEENIQNTFTGVMPYWKKENQDGTETLVMLPERVVYSSNAQNFPYNRTKILDCSQKWGSQPTESQLRAYATSYVNDTGVGIPEVNITVKFLPLWQTEEYKNIANLERVNLCDTVTVEFEKLGISATAKVIRTKFDVLKDRYEEVELGEAKTSFASSISNRINETANAIKQSIPKESVFRQIVNEQTLKITGGLGGHVVMTLNANDEPQEILIMDTDDAQTAVNVIRINQAGIGFSTNGYNGPFQSAWTIDGHFNADFIATGHLLANFIQGGTLSLGGVDNGDGVLYVNDASGSPIIIADNSGLRVTKGLIEGPDIRSKGQYSVDGISYQKWAMLKDGEFRIMDAVYSATVPQTVKANFGLRDDLWAVIECLMTSNYGAGIAFSVPGFNQADGNGRIYGMKFYKAVTKNIPVMHLNGALFLRAAGNHRGIFWDQRSLLTTGKTNFDDDNESYGILPHIIAGSVYGTNVVGGLYVNGNSVSSSSSARYKENISEKMDGKNDPHRLLLLKAKQGKYKKEYGYKLQYADMAGKTVPMFIAEDVAEIYPSAVIHNEDGEVESWDERRIIPGMLALIQEQDKTIKNLEARLAKLEELLT